MSIIFMNVQVVKVTIQSDNSRSFCVTATDESGEIHEYELSDMLFKKVASTKKEIIVNKWELTHDNLNNIVSMKKL